MIEELIKILVNIVVPGLAGITFFALAKFVKQVAPLRALIASQQVYTSAFLAFLVFGFYLGLRPVQVLAGPHPWPLVISTIREFLLIAVFGPALFIAMTTLCFGPEKIGLGWIATILIFGFISAVLFCVFNALAIGGSEEIVKLGKLTAYDGLWYKSKKDDIDQLMNILFVIHLINPGILILIACGLVLYRAKNYPEDKRKLYDNMPKKLYLLSGAFCAYSLTVILGSFCYGHQRIPDQWGIYHLGSLCTGILEAVSLSLPVRRDVQLSEHED